MSSFDSIFGVAIIALGMVLTPGPNMVYLASRAISQGRNAGMVSLAGVALGFVFYLLAAALGLAKLFETFPITFTIVKILGAVYLAYLAWNMLRPNGSSPFETRDLKPCTNFNLFSMGFVTNVLNPKIALMYAALIPQFVDIDRGSTLRQFAELGSVQILIAVTINSIIILAASSISGTLSRRPRIMQTQRVVSGVVLGIFSIKLLLV